MTSSSKSSVNWHDLAPMIDPEILIELDDELGIEEVVEVIVSVLEFNRTSLEQIQQAASDDFATIARHAHAIKGTAGSIGAVQLVEAAEHVELSARAEDGGSLDASIAALMTRADDAEELIRTNILPVGQKP